MDRQGIGMTSQRARDRLVASLEAMDINSQLVLGLIRDTPRHLFVDEALASRAYENNALPIGYGQTISQPYIVARMTEALLGSRPLEKVLEVGAGCGYQSAILAGIAKQIYSIERLKPMANKLRRRLHRLKYHNILVRHGDGFAGWTQYAPFDAILVAAAPRSVPPALIDQLALGGRLVIPVGRAGQQKLLLLTRGEDGIEEHFLDAVSFVPMLDGLS